MKAEAQTVCGESTVVESTGQTPTRAPVKGLSRLATYIRGKEILILGPGSAGKTKFAQYLQLAALDPEGKREMTYAVTRSPAFVVDFGREQGLVLRVRRAVDTPGQVGPLQHAILVARRRPHAVIVMLDCGGDPRGTLRWFCLFCDALDSVLRKVPSVARKLQEMVVILNKRDKIDDREFAKLQQAVRKALERFLSVVWGAERVRSIPILECVSVRTGHGTALIDGVIAQLTERLAGRQGQQGAAAGPGPAGVLPADPRPDPSRPSGQPASAPSSPPPGRQDTQAAAAGAKPGIVSPAGARPNASRPSYKPTPAPSSPPPGRQEKQDAAAAPRFGVVSSSSPRPGSSRRPYRPAATPPSGPAHPTPGTPKP
jgi:hypothetical protein